MSYSFPCPQLYISTNQNWYSASNTPWSKYAEYMLGRRCLWQRPGEWQFTRPWQTEVKGAVYLSLITWDLFPQLWEPNYVCSLHSIVTIYNNYISNNYLIKYQIFDVFCCVGIFTKPTGLAGVRVKCATLAWRGSHISSWKVFVNQQWFKNQL